MNNWTEVREEFYIITFQMHLKSIAQQLDFFFIWRDISTRTKETHLIKTQIRVPLKYHHFVSLLAILTWVFPYYNSSFFPFISISLHPTSCNTNQTYSYTTEWFFIESLLPLSSHTLSSRVTHYTSFNHRQLLKSALIARTWMLLSTNAIITPL